MEDTNKKVCPACGTENEADAMVCVSCGADLSDTGSKMNDDSMSKDDASMPADKPMDNGMDSGNDSMDNGTDSGDMGGDSGSSDNGGDQSMNQ